MQIDGITGSVAIEFGNQTYVKALDNGLFTLGAPHSEGKLNEIT
jgi:protein FRG1